MSDEHDPNDAEQGEADALARALERGAGSAELPEDALEAAALLRYSRDGGELASERRQAVLDEVLATARFPEPSRARSGLRWLAWLAPAGGLATAAALVLLVTVQEPAPTRGPDTAALPAPSAALLSAQAATASGEQGGRERLAEEMRSYRGHLYAALGARYGGVP